MELTQMKLSEAMLGLYELGEEIKNLEPILNIGRNGSVRATLDEICSRLETISRRTEHLDEVDAVNESISELSTKLESMKFQIMGSPYPNQKIHKLFVQSTGIIKPSIYGSLN